MSWRVHEAVCGVRPRFLPVTSVAAVRAKSGVLCTVRVAWAMMTRARHTVTPLKPQDTLLRHRAPGRPPQSRDGHLPRDLDLQRW